MTSPIDALRETARQTKALGLLVVRYWARAGLPNRLRKDRGRRTSGGLLRATFIALMVHWGYRIGSACAVVEPDARAASVTWLVLGLLGLSAVWGTMGPTPAMRQAQAPTTSPLLDALPMREASRVTVGLVERSVLFALAIPALFSAAPRIRLDLVAVGLLLPVSGLLLGEGIVRLLKTVMAPARVARLSTVMLVLQFPVFLLVGAAPAVGRATRLTRVVAFARPIGDAVLEGTNAALLLGLLACVTGVGALAIRVAERAGYDRVDLVPTRRYPPAKTRDLDLVRVEAVLGGREPGGKWLVRLAFLYTTLFSGGLLLASRFASMWPQELGSAFVRSLGFVAIIAGFVVVQNRATRMVVRDAGARPMLAPLPIAPRDLLRGKTRAIALQAVVVAAPYLILLGVPSPAATKVEVLWRGLTAIVALALASEAMVSVAFLTQGVGGVRTVGGTIALETTLVALPLFAIAAAPHPWAAIVSLASLAMLAFEARRSALQCLRWLDDADDFERETPVWRALLVFAAFQAAQTLARRALVFTALPEAIVAAIAYGVAAVVLVVLTGYGRRGLARMRVLPEGAGRSGAFLAIGALLGAASGSAALGYLRLLRALRVELPEISLEGGGKVVVTVVAIALAPVAEEIFFRGWLGSAIEGELPERRRWLAPLLTAFAFAAVHPPLSFVPVFVLGLACGVLFTRTRAIGPGIVAHAVHNALAALLAS
ncbi:MAG: CPBP family intramembrane metalloprotease [Deltaproteobacteria bacterium]|nr:CPBP family intramembrane metalloprotease [Deltaproteobacteria bacterium]